MVLNDKERKKEIKREREEEREKKMKRKKKRKGKKLEVLAREGGDRKNKELNST